MHETSKIKFGPKSIVENALYWIDGLRRVEDFQFEYECIAAPYLVKYGYKIEYPILNTFLFAPLRIFLYFLARQFNDWRYQKRDRKVHDQGYRES